jgi:hypothetical protein
MAKLGERRCVPDKLIDTWTYKVKDVEIETLEWQEPEDGDHMKDEREFDDKYKRGKKRIRDKLVTVNVYMVKRTEQSEEAPHPLKDATLIVKCPELGIKVEGTDIGALKDTMWSMLDEKYEISWERFYQVQVQETRIYGGDGTGLEIVYDDVYRGKTWDGKMLIKRWRGHEFKIDVWPGAFKDEKGKVMACIPATEENRQALKEFCKRTEALRKLLADFLRPEVIQQNLARLAGCNLLPPAPADAKEDEDE